MDAAGHENHVVACQIGVPRTGLHSLSFEARGRLRFSFCRHWIDAGRCQVTLVTGRDRSWRISADARL
jgi:hypothetical protein